VPAQPVDATLSLNNCSTNAYPEELIYLTDSAKASQDKAPA